MIATMFPALTFLAVIGSGLAAGLFFIFSNTIMASFARLPAAQGIAAMQQINLTIINPAFMVVFMGLAVLSLALAAKAVFGWSEPGAAWLLAGSVAYLLGCLAVTLVFNVPLNDALAAVDPASADGAAMWARYLKEWLPWNHVRTAACMGSLGAFVMALVRAA
ncbi:anthrone oxygenase family protein [Aminobacter sp. HY435]|uniref:anthrone oxygenase family protein n=1 Tax=Aminobacter sp. HY435 TaxID=2970917 RepID=UPI0022B9790F|nr:anthrone oxygenase family protein [Aminobacter sp. HY435]